MRLATFGAAFVCSWPIVLDAIAVKHMNIEVRTAAVRRMDRKPSLLVGGAGWYEMMYVFTSLRFVLDGSF